jgi:hypothetical protein
MRPVVTNSPSNAAKSHASFSTPAPSATPCWPAFNPCVKKPPALSAVANTMAENTTPAFVSVPSIGQIKWQHSRCLPRLLKKFLQNLFAKTFGFDIFSPLSNAKINRTQ